MSGEDLLVPVRESVTLRNTVAYAMETAAERAADAPVTVHFVFPLSRRVAAGEEPSGPSELLDRIEVWAAEDLGDEHGDVSVRTALLGRDEYLFNPSDYAAVIHRYAADHGVRDVLFDPEFNPSGATPLLPPFETELERRGLDVVVAPVERQARRFPLVRRTGMGNFFVLFAATFGFYLLLAGTLATFDLATGAISAGIVSAVLWRISLSGASDLPGLVARVVRGLIYAPYLLWQIVVANVQIAYVTLHPSMPIDPEMVEFDAAVWSELPVTTLANSITLTPGTLTVDVTRRHFTVHTLTRAARDDLLAGGLERAVRFVFYGRSAARLPSPTERGAVGDEDPGGDDER